MAVFARRFAAPSVLVLAALACASASQAARSPPPQWQRVPPRQNGKGAPGEERVVVPRVNVAYEDDEKPSE